MSFSAELFRTKLSNLSESSQSIQTLSHWAQFHKKHVKESANVWATECMRQSSSSRRLQFIYLANDIMQNSRRKGPEFVKEYGKEIGRILPAIHAGADDRVKDKIVRLLGIWEERHVIPSTLIAELRSRIGGAANVRPSSKPSSSSSRSPKPGAPPPLSSFAPPSAAAEGEYSPSGGGISPKGFGGALGALGALAGLTGAPKPGGGPSGGAGAIAALGGAPLGVGTHSPNKRMKLSPSASMEPPQAASLPLADLLLSFDEGSLVDELQAEREADLDMGSLAHVTVSDPSQINSVTAKAGAATKLLTSQRGQLQQELAARSELILLLAASVERQHKACEELSGAVEAVDKQLAVARGAQEKVAGLRAQMDSIADMATEAM